MIYWTVLLLGSRLGFIQEDMSWGDSTPEKAKHFMTFMEATNAAVLVQALYSDICQIRLIRWSDFGAVKGFATPPGFHQPP